MNGGRSAILTKNGRPALTMSLSCNEAGLVSDIFITLNPAKLARLEPVDIHQGTVHARSTLTFSTLPEEGCVTEAA